MRRRRLALACLACLALAVLTILTVVAVLTATTVMFRAGASPSFSGARIPRPTPAADPRPAGARPAAGVALLVTAPGATFTSLYVAFAGDASPGALLAGFDHVEDTAVRGAVLAPASSGWVVLATAGGSLFRLVAHRPPERLAEGIARGSRPLVTATGRVFVARAAPGPASPGACDLAVDEIDPATGAARTVHATQGHVLSLAGAFGREILVYRVGSAGADLAAVDPGSGAVRLVVPRISPYARDFSVDPDTGTLLFQGRDEADPRAFTIERVDLTTGAHRRLYNGTSMTLAPFAWPGGGVAYNHETSGGLTLLGGTRPLAAGLLGPGVDLVEAVSAGRDWVAGVHGAPGGGPDAGGLPVPFTVDTRTGAAAFLPAPTGGRVYVAGFVEGPP